MDRKERALELARQQYADGGGPRYTPSYTEHGALIGPSMRDRANMVRDAFDSAAGHPFVRVAREYPREMAQEIGSSVVGGIYVRCVTRLALRKSVAELLTIRSSASTLSDTGRLRSGQK